MMSGNAPKRISLDENRYNPFAKCRSPAARMLILLLCLGLGAATSVLLGQDANWDLKNYHLYLGWAALNGRFGTDFLDMQTYFYPTLDIPYSWLILGPLADHPRLLAAVMGLWYGALIGLVWMLASEQYASWTAGPRWMAIASAVLVASTGTATITQLGTTYNEIQVSLLVLAALLVAQKLVRAETCYDNSVGEGVAPLSFQYLLGIGALLGLATGLKFTAGIYSPAMCLSLITVVSLRKWVRWCSLIVLGWLPAFALSAGWWAWKLWSKFGSPTFPIFNGLFRSDWYPPASFYDWRFLPRTVWEWLFYPLDWIYTQNSVIELPFRDARGAAVLLLGLLATSITVANRIRLKRCSVGTCFQFSKEQQVLFTFLVCSYIIWLSTSSILRYAIPIEVAGGLSIPLLVCALSSPLPLTLRRPVWATTTCGLILLVVFTTHYPDLQRAPFRSPAIHADLGWIKPGTMVVLAGTATSYVVPFLPAEVRPVSVDNTLIEARGFRLYDKVARQLRDHNGPFVLLWDPNEAWMPQMVEQAGLSLELGSCRDVNAAIGAARQPLKACPGYLRPAPKLSSDFWQKAAHYYTRIEVHEQWPPRWSYPAFATAAGKAARGIEIIDRNEKLWPLPKFGNKIRPDTLYILDTAGAKKRAAKVVNPKADMLSEIDSFLVLAPGWKNILSHLPPERSTHPTTDRRSDGAQQRG